MATYCISFRIGEVDTWVGSAAERRQSLIDAAYQASDGYWDETTSFIIAGMNLDTPGALAEIVRGLDQSVDLVIVFDPADMSLSRFGNFSAPEVLDSFFAITV